MTYQFDSFEIDLATRELRCDGAPIGMEPKVFDLLVYLVENSERVASRDMIIENVWQGRIVSDAAISSCIKNARSVLGDNGQAQRYIKTVHGRGFRFVGSFNQEFPKTTVPAATNPSLAIMPFHVHGTRPDLDQIGDALVDDLITILPRVPLLSLASRRSCFALKGTTMSSQEIHAQLNVTYLLEGSLQQSTDGCRVRLQLVRAETGFHSWARQFDVPDDVKETGDLLKVILPRLETALVETMVADLTLEEGPKSVNAQLIHAMGLLSLRGWNPDAFSEAEAVLRDLLYREPNHPIAHAYLALIMGLGSRIGMFEVSDEIIKNTIKEAEIALDLAKGDSTVLGIAACAIADVGFPDRAIPLLKKALDLNPNNAQAWVALGAAYLLVEKYQEAVDALMHGVQMSAMDAQIAIWLSFLGMARLLLGDIDGALEHAKDACQADDRNHIPHMILAAVELARKNDTGCAGALRQAQRIHPEMSKREVYRLVGRDLGVILYENMQNMPS